MRFRDGTMLIWMRQFNLNFRPGAKPATGTNAPAARRHPGARFILPSLCLALAASTVLLSGCQTDKKSKIVGALRVHIEVTVPTTTSQSVSVLRSTPVLVTILKDPVLTEANIIGARLIETPGGVAVQVKFDETTGLWILQQYSAANPGKHFVIYGQWGDKPSEGRWLAAPLITHRIADGVLTFTADASREELDQLVTGLNNVVKQNRGPAPKMFR